MKKLLDLRVNGWIFLAFSCLFFAVLAIAALFATLDIIGICYSELKEISVETGERLAVYEYIVDKEGYSYSVSIGDTREFLVPVSETVFYFKEYPSVQTYAAVEFFIYPTIIALLGLCFALIFRYGQDLLKSDSPRLGMYIVPLILTLLSLGFAWHNVTEACGIYTSLLSATSNSEESVKAIAKTLFIVNVNLLIWGIWTKLVERRVKKNSENKQNQDA